MRLPFGKYKGHDLEELDTHYLVWCWENLDRISPKLRAAIYEELCDRGETVEPDPEPEPEPEPEPVRGQLNLNLAIAPAQLQLFADLVESGYRSLAKRIHPDVPGGDLIKMTDLTIMVHGIRRSVERVSPRRRKGAA